MLSILSFQAVPDRSGGLFRRNRVQADVRSLSGCRYVCIRCEMRPAQDAPRPADWRMISACCLEPSGRLLTPAGAEIPASSGLRRFRPTRYCRRLAENLALDALGLCAKPPSVRSVAVYGREAEVTALLPRLVPLAGRVHVITRRAYAIESAVAELERQTGACITLSASMDARGYDMLLAPSGGAGVIATDDGSVVFSPDRPLCAEAVHISAALPSLPPELAELGGIFDHLELCGAFCELGGMSRLAAASPRCGILRGREVGADEITALI